MLHTMFDACRMRSLNAAMPLATVTNSMQIVLETFTKKMAAYEEEQQDGDSITPSLDDSLRTTEYSSASLDLSTFYQSLIRQHSSAAIKSAGQQSQPASRDSSIFSFNYIDTTGHKRDKEGDSRHQNIALALQSGDDCFNKLIDYNTDHRLWGHDYYHDMWSGGMRSINKAITFSSNEVIAMNNDDAMAKSKDDVMAMNNYEVMNNDNEMAMNNDEVMATNNDDVMTLSSDDVMAMSNNDVIALSNDDVMAMNNDVVMTMNKDNVMAMSNGEVMTMSNDDVMATSDGEVMTMSNDDVMMAMSDGEVMTMSNDDVMAMSDGEVMTMSKDELMTLSNDEVMTRNDELMTMSKDEVITVAYNQIRGKKKSTIGNLFLPLWIKAKDPKPTSRLPTTCGNNDEPLSATPITQRQAEGHNIPHATGKADRNSKAATSFLQKLKSLFVSKKQMTNNDVKFERVDSSYDQTQWSMAIEREEKESQSRKEAAEKKRRDQQFVSALESKGLHVFKIEGDGNCLFRAVSHQLFMNQGYHEELRLKAVDHLIRHRNRFEQFCGEDFDRHVEEMRKLATWGDELEIRALEEITDRLIRIYRSDQENFDEPGHDDPTEVDLLDGVSPITLSYHGGSHYNSVCDERHPLPLSRRRSRILLDSRRAASRGSVRNSHRPSRDATILRNYNPYEAHKDPRYGSQPISNQVFYNQPSSTAVNNRSIRHYNQNMEVMQPDRRGAGAHPYSNGDRSYHYSRQGMQQVQADHPYMRSSSSVGVDMNSLHFGDVSASISNPNASLRGGERYDRYPYRSNAAPPRAYEYGATQYSGSFHTDSFDRSGFSYGTRSNVYGYYK